MLGYSTVPWMVKTYGSLHTGKLQLISLAITRHQMTDVRGRKMLITALKTVGHI